MSTNGLTAGNTASSVRAFLLNFDGDDAGIRDEELDVNNQPICDLSGRKVNGQLPKGIYIVNGKKVMVK